VYAKTRNKPPNCRYHGTSLLYPCLDVSSTCVCACVWMYVYERVCVRVYMCACICVRVYVREYAHAYMCVYVCMFV